MAKKIRSDGRTMAQIVDVYEAIKRAMIRRGLFPIHGNGTSDESNEDKISNEKRERAEKKDRAEKKEKRKLTDFFKESDEIICKADSVFPFQLIPDTITIDRQKVTIAHRTFIRVAKIISVRVHDMLSVEADVGPFFGTVLLTSRFFSNNPQKISWLPRKDAVKVQRILQGYIIAHQKDIDCSKIPKDELAKLLERLGQGVTD